MTKKHFIAIAAIMADNEYPEGSTEYSIGRRDCWSDIALGLADLCATFNPLFDRDRFLQACRGE